ncbi:MAG: 4'-phosphopantetheinyl transferase [Chloroflexi bacterium]|nr:MAG: 4'-phosphopantetheinyl transferase [Chloroflexota bacterium]
MTGGQEDRRKGRQEDKRTRGREDERYALLPSSLPPFFPSSPPPPGAVHIWYARLDPPDSAVAQCEQTLSADEWARLRRFHFARDARRYAVRRGVLRHLLGDYLAIPPAEVAFVYGPQQKPALAAPLAETGLHFNLSDSGEMAVYAFAAGQAIGVDIEEHRDYPDARQLAQRFFSPVEAEWLYAQPEPQTSLAFLRCWACKEAVVKALGDGLMAPLQEFTVAHWQSPPRLLWPAAAATEWSVHLLNPPANYSAALTTTRPITTIREQSFLFATLPNP